VPTRLMDPKEEKFLLLFRGKALRPATVGRRGKKGAWRQLKFLSGPSYGGDVGGVETGRQRVCLAWKEETQGLPGGNAIILQRKRSRAGVCVGKKIRPFGFAKQEIGTMPQGGRSPWKETDRPFSVHR